LTNLGTTLTNVQKTQFTQNQFEMSSPTGNC
jgi:hypothetical protein